MLKALLENICIKGKGIDSEGKDEILYFVPCGSG